MLMNIWSSITNTLGISKGSADGTTSVVANDTERLYDHEYSNFRANPVAIAVCEEEHAPSTEDRLCATRDGTTVPVNKSPIDVKDLPAKGVMIYERIVCSRVLEATVDSSATVDEPVAPNIGSDSDDEYEDAVENIVVDGNRRDNIRKMSDSADEESHNPDNENGAVEGNCADDDADKDDSNGDSCADDGNGSSGDNCDDKDGFDKTINAETESKESHSAQLDSPKDSPATSNSQSTDDLSDDDDMYYDALDSFYHEPAQSLQCDAPKNDVDSDEDDTYVSCEEEFEKDDRIDDDNVEEGDRNDDDVEEDDCIDDVEEGGRIDNRIQSIEIEHTHPRDIPANSDCFEDIDLGNPVEDGESSAANQINGDQSMTNGDQSTLESDEKSEEIGHDDEVITSEAAAEPRAKKRYPAKILRFLNRIIGVSIKAVKSIGGLVLRSKRTKSTVKEDEQDPRQVRLHQLPTGQ